MRPVTGDPAHDKLQKDYRRARKEVSAAVLSKDQAKLKQERAEKERDALMKTNARLLKQSSDKDDMNAKSLSTILHLKQRNEELEKENAIIKEKAKAAQQLSLAARLASNAKNRVGEEALKEKELIDEKVKQLQAECHSLGNEKDRAASLLAQSDAKTSLIAKDLDTARSRCDELVSESNKKEEEKKQMVESLAVVKKEATESAMKAAAASGVSNGAASAFTMDQMTTQVKYLSGRINCAVCNVREKKCILLRCRFFFFFAPVTSHQNNTMTSSNKSSITDIESATPSIAEDEVVVAEVPKANDKGRSGAANYRKLSTVSRMYDVDGDGELDDAEQAMRDMDKSGRGYLTNDNVYRMMKEQIETQKQLFRVKRIMFVLLALVVILALSNLGTSFAAASLSKDTATSSSAQIVDKRTNEGLSTQTSTNAYEIQRATITPDGRRKLCVREDGNVDCALEEPGEGSVLTMDAGMCRKVLRQCKRGNTVKLTRPWLNDDQSDYEVCPYSGQLSKYNRSTLTNNQGKTVIIEPIEGGHCRVSGEAVLQGKGDTCDVGDDCAPGLGCRKVERFISACQNHCARLRFAPRMVGECQVNCDHPTCQENDVE